MLQVTSFWDAYGPPGPTTLPKQRDDYLTPGYVAAADDLEVYLRMGEGEKRSGPRGCPDSCRAEERRRIYEGVGVVGFFPSICLFCFLLIRGDIFCCLDLN